MHNVENNPYTIGLFCFVKLVDREGTRFVRLCLAGIFHTSEGLGGLRLFHLYLGLQRLSF